MQITVSNIVFTFSTRKEPTKLSQEKKREVGGYVDLDCDYQGQTASITLEKGLSSKSQAERMTSRLPGEWGEKDVKALADFLKGK